MKNNEDIVLYHYGLTAGTTSLDDPRPFIVSGMQNIDMFVFICRSTCVAEQFVAADHSHKDRRKK